MGISITHSSNVFHHDGDIYVNPVNTVGVMGAGLASAFKRRYPEMYRAYRSAYLHGQLHIGKIFVWDGPPVVVCLPTKRHFRESSKIEDVELGLIDFRGFLIGAIHRSEKRLRVIMPPLGCGLGGLAWPDVKYVIDFCMRDLDADIVVCLRGDER